jgi:hypothetical protein
MRLDARGSRLIQAREIALKPFEYRFCVKCRQVNRIERWLVQYRIGILCGSQCSLCVLESHFDIRVRFQGTKFINPKFTADS